MFTLVYAPVFVRNFKRLELALQEEVLEKLELLKNKVNHRALRVHKLKSDLRGFYSASVNYSFRIVFFYGKDRTINFLNVGNHAIYD